MKKSKWRLGIFLALIAAFGCGGNLTQTNFMSAVVNGQDYRLTAGMVFAGAPGYPALDGQAAGVYGLIPGPTLELVAYDAACDETTIPGRAIKLTLTKPGGIVAGATYFSFADEVSLAIYDNDQLIVYDSYSDTTLRLACRITEFDEVGGRIAGEFYGTVAGGEVFPIQGEFNVKRYPDGRINVIPAP